MERSVLVVFQQYPLWYAEVDLFPTFPLHIQAYGTSERKRNAVPIGMIAGFDIDSTIQ